MRAFFYFEITIIRHFYKIKLNFFSHLSGMRRNDLGDLRPGSAGGQAMAHSFDNQQLCAGFGIACILSALNRNEGIVGSMDYEGRYPHGFKGRFSVFFQDARLMLENNFLVIFTSYSGQLFVLICSLTEIPF
jgi:hypothetical protein